MSSSNTTLVTARFQLRVSSPEIHVNTNLIHLAKSYVNTILLQNLDDSLSEFQYFSEPVELTGVRSKFLGYCEPTRSQLKARETVTEFCGYINSKMTITGEQTPFVPHTVISAIRRYLSKNKSFLQAIDLSYAGKKLNTAYLGWTLHGVQSELTTPQLKQFESSVADFLQDRTSGPRPDGVLSTNQELIPDTNETKLNLYTAVFGEDRHDMPFDSLVLDSFEDGLDSFLDTLKRNTKPSLFADVEGMEVFAARIPTTGTAGPNPNSATAAQPSPKAGPFLAVEHLDIKGLHDVRLWVAIIVWIVVCMLSLAIAIGYTKMQREKEAQVEHQEKAPKKVMAEP